MKTNSHTTSPSVERWVFYTPKSGWLARPLFMGRLGLFWALAHYNDNNRLLTKPVCPIKPITNTKLTSTGRMLLFKDRWHSLFDFSRLTGPFTITKVFPYGTVELSQANGPNFKVNGHRVKHYFGGDVPQLVVLDLQTFPSDQ
nr:reverse transcriptase domain-containing protein [Tanacetum cinerariifolium]